MPLDRQAGQCFAKGCPDGAKPNQLMCWPHWKRVPRVVQDVIWTSNYLAHPHYETSRLAAQASIAAKEGRLLGDAELSALERYGLGRDGHPDPRRIEEYPGIGCCDEPLEPNPCHDGDCHGCCRSPIHPDVDKAEVEN